LKRPRHYGRRPSSRAEVTPRDWRRSIRGQNADQLPARPGRDEERADQVQTWFTLSAAQWSAQLDHRSNGGVGVCRRGNEASPNRGKRSPQIGSEDKDRNGTGHSSEGRLGAGPGRSRVRSGREFTHCVQHARYASTDCSPPARSLKRPKRPRHGSAHHRSSGMVRLRIDPRIRPRPASEIG